MHYLQSYTRSGGGGRLLKLTLLLALVLITITLTPGNAWSAAPIAMADQLPAAQLSAANWVFQGPAPQVYAQQDLANVAEPDEPVSGAVAAIAASPTNPDLVYIGAANGGVWKTTNATAPNPTWTPLTDQLQSLSIGIDALELDPLDATGQTVIAGTGRFSGYANRGDDLVGLYYTTDGGATWTTTTSSLLSAAKITGVATRGSILLAASENGLYRSTTGPLGTWSEISGTGILPDTRASSIVADPNDTNVLYVTFTGASGGLFRTNDLGATWTNITGNINAISSNTTAFDVAVFNDGSTHVITALLSGTVNGAEANAIFRSVNGAAFTTLDVPFVFTNAYGKFGIVADKMNSNIVYVSGGYALTGSNPFLATTTRIDASQPSGSQLTLLYSGVSTKILTSMTTTQTYMYVDSTASFLTATPFTITVDGEQMTVTAVTKPSWYYRLAITRGVNGTTAADHIVYKPVFSGAAYGAPHVDINTLATNANGSLLMGAHGGIFQMPNPNGSPSATNTWLSKNGNLGVSEMHDIAYDHVTHTLIGSNQDNCVVFQSAPGSLTWPVGPGFSGDGGDVAVADIGGGQSVRYAANQNIGSFQRLVYDAANNLVSATTLSTAVITDKQFTTPIAVNAVDPNRLLIGGSANLYESLNMGDTINKIATVGVYSKAMAYGGRQNGVNNPDVLYVASGTDTFYARTTAGGAVTAFPVTGAWYIRDIVINPEDWENVFAIDANQVFMTSDSGATWSDITGNLLSISSDEITTIEFVEAPSPYIVVGTRSGVFASNLGAAGNWFELGTVLPDVLVYELDYDAVDDVLVAATLGRGAWLLPDASTALTPLGVPPVLALTGAASADEGSTQTYTFTVDDPGDSFTVNSLTVGAGGELVAGSLVTTATGGSFQVNYPDGPASANLTLQVLDSTGELSNLETIAVTVSNLKPTVAILGAPTSGSPGTTVNLSSSVTDPSPTDTTAGFTYYWLVQKYVNDVYVGNLATGSTANFSYTPDVEGKYNVFFRAQDKDGVWSSYASKTIYAASPDLTADTFTVTVPEGTTAANIGTFQNVNGNPVTLTASVGSLSLTPTSSSVIYNSFSPAGALAGPTVDSVFTLSQPYLIAKIFNWHQNSSFPSGQDPATVGGMISILDYPAGTVRGTWTAAGANSNLAWEVLPNIILPPGSYQIVESQTGSSSWSYTTTGGSPEWEPYKGLSQVTAANFSAGNWSWSYTPDDGAADSQDVTITATDDVNSEVTSLPFSLIVENIAPTATFASNFSTVGEGRTRNLSFSNQFDPSTADSTAGFRYAYDFDNDGIFEIGDGTYAGSSISSGASTPANFAVDGPGSLVVHGRIIDKDDGYTDYTYAFTINNIAPTASVTGPANALVDQLATFVLSASDVLADKAAGFTYSVDWGDGSPLQTVTPVEGTGNAVVHHAFAAANSYTVQVTATDKDGGVSLAASKTITVSTLNASTLQSLIATTPFVELAPANDAALQNAVTAVNGLTDPGTPVAITIILDDGPYSSVTLSAPDNIILDLAGNDTKDVNGTQITSTAGPAVTVTSGEVFVQGDHLATSADAPTVLVTGGHLTLDQVDIQESAGFNNVAVRVTGGSVNLGFDVIMNVNGDGGFVDSYERSALTPHPEGIDAELTPNTFQVTQVADDGSLIQATIKAVSLSSTSLTSSATTTTVGEDVTFTAVVDVKASEHGPATGTVNFYEGETLLGTGEVNYVGGQFVADFSTDALGIGEHVITAIYGGDEAYVASSTELTHEVIVPPNEAPVAVDDSYSTTVDTALTITAPGVLANDTDADGDVLTAVKVADPTHGTLTLNADGSFVYAPNAGYVGPDSFTYVANDGQADSNVATVSIAVNFSFSGFFSPVDNPPVMNQAKAGSAVPVKFSLGGNQGLNILAAGYPTSMQVVCDNNAPTDNIEETATSNSGLTYDPVSGQYNFVWKTLKSWKGTCRQFTLRLVDGTDHIALFRFK